MVLRPTDVLRTSDEDREEIARVEERLDGMLKKEARSHYRGTPITIAADLLGGDYVIRNEILARYRRAGWVVTFQSDQRDGDFYTFEVEQRRRLEVDER